VEQRKLTLKTSFEIVGSVLRLDLHPMEPLAKDYVFTLPRNLRVINLSLGSAIINIITSTKIPVVSFPASDPDRVITEGCHPSDVTGVGKMFPI